MSDSRPGTGSDGSPFVFIDLLKAIAAQLIVLHHLAFYGPMADHVRPVLPGLIDWLAANARIAVQVFLVIGGFLAAKSLSRTSHFAIVHPLYPLHPLGTILRRYARLAPPFFIAILLAISASAWARIWMAHDSIPAPVDLLQLAAHALLVHGVLGFESLSAGAWYVAMDFQLYATLALLLWLSARLAATRPLPWLAPVMVIACAGCSLLYFNRDSGWDAWAPYFFGSYGLGALAWWASDPSRRPASAGMLLAAMLLPTLAALAIDYRSRIAVALAVACGLVLAGRVRMLHDASRWTFVRRMGRISYSVFLVHFPVCLVVNAAFARFVSAQPLWQGIGLLLAWAASLAAGAAFHRWVEHPLTRYPVRRAGAFYPA